MNPPPETPLNIQDVPKLISKYWVSIVITTLLCTGVSLAVANHLPKKYKAHFVLTIDSKYFQSPLVGDFVPELSESGEGRAQRESLIRQVLTPDYLDSLGTKYGIYASTQTSTPASSWPFNLKELGKAFGFFQPGSRDSALSAEREDLRSRIEIDARDSTTFQIGFVYSDPAVALQVMQDIYGHVIQNLLEIRMHSLSNIRDAIQSRVTALSVNLSAPLPAASDVPAGTQNLEEELKNVRAQLRAMTSQYTEEHPLVVQLRDQERSLVSRLNNLSGESSARSLRRERSLREGASGESTRDIYSDLTKKLNYLNIAMDSDRQHQNDYFATLEPPLYPSSSLGPKKALIGLWGFAFGLFGSLFISAIREYFDRSTLHAAEVAHQLHVPLLGELPVFPSKSAR